MKPPPPPLDQAQRDRFIRELDKNFSVIAPAGVGKTRAIVERIVQIAHHDLNPGLSSRDRWLPRLMVVTYTNRAAEEMQSRARNHLIREKLPPEVLSWFNQAFFGTIHSLCLRILQQHGYYLGLPARPELVQNEDELWLEFIRQTGNPAPDLAPESLSGLLRFVPLSRLLNLGKNAPPSGPIPPWPEFPDCDFNAVFAAPLPANPSSKKAAQGRLALLKDWTEKLSKGQGNLAFPPEPTAAAAELLSAWQESFRPLHRWLNQACHHYAATVAHSFQQFRIRRGVLSYQDQLQLAARLMRIEPCRRKLCQDAPRIILDEAQDTDTSQFEVLLALATPPEENWNPEQPAPAPGQFCMVGDPQQSIYGERADVRYYTRLHENLRQKGLAEELKFQVTFRCDQAIIREVNRVFPQVLDGQGNQVSFVPLMERPGALPGQFACLTLVAPPGLDPKAGVALKVREEAAQLASWILEKGLSGLGASSWSQVAVLCPRNRVLGSMAQGFREAGLRVQLQSQRSILGDQPAYAWLAALVKIMASPGDEFEIVGVLREIFGHSDHDLGTFAHARREGGNRQPFSLRAFPKSTDPVEKTLDALHSLSQTLSRLSLSDGIRTLLAASGLPERLNTLKEPPFSSALIETLLLQADLAEEEGLALSDFAERLENHFHDREESQPLVPDAIQLISCQKSKGLEWETVLVPFFFHQIRFIDDSWPRMIRVPGRAAETVCSKASDLNGLIELHERHRAQELQRLLYVTLTRGKHLTVVVDDRSIFAPVKTPKNCFARLLHVADDGINGEAWKNLPELSPPGEISAPRNETTLEASTLPGNFSAFLSKALQRAAAFPHRVLPHTLAHPNPREDPEIRREREPEWPQPAEENPGILYGTWWHETVELIPWKKERSAWNAIFHQRHFSCPQPERGLREWDLLLQSPIPRRLQAKGTVVHSELPFLLPRSSAECLEGIIDLAAYETAGESWLILDWKTDAVTRAADLKSHYGPQIQAYLDAIAAITKLPVAGLLYSTRLGQSVDL